MNLSDLQKAAAIMTVGMLFIPLGDTAGKLLGANNGVQPVFIAWSRFAIGAMLVFVLMGGKRFDFAILKDWRVWFRASLITGGITCILTALKTEPVADVFAAFFVGPILSYFLSAWLLKEQISLSRTMLLFFGFCGVLLVVKPGVDFSTGLAWALGAGMFYGMFLVATKWLVEITNPRSLLLSHLVIGALLLSPWGIPAMPEFTPTIGWLVVVSAAASAIGNLLYVLASRMADASRLAPLVYVQLVSATTFGIVIFNDFPDTVSLIGLGLLLACGFGSFFVGHAKKR